MSDLQSPSPLGLGFTVSATEKLVQRNQTPELSAGADLPLSGMEHAKLRRWKLSSAIETPTIRATTPAPADTFPFG